ncbi:hypothetical protein L598_003400000160 [Mesorhizobium sp. J18]|uniref:hypothetical protein n=1 Tax=Mesorhizobium sp. J18 TaxID=935263 RepID=UPI00119B4E5E|nr:hypothetical protein [Mesorhizobium sp. J18]TWG94754.1 hypothetical protein L598_003400000160 [Mesorhizobium sp. J18]
MPMQLTKDTLFIQKPSRAETKSDITTQVARSIIEQEAAAREAKSRRLKELRLKKEAEATDTAPAARKSRPRKATPKTRLAGR